MGLEVTKCFSLHFQSNNRKWYKKVQQDWGILQNNLPGQ